MIVSSAMLEMLFECALHCECISQVQEYAKKKGITLSRSQVIEILSNPKHREKNASGSQFDLVQQKIRTEKDTENVLLAAKKKGMSWRDAVFMAHISPGPDYSRLRSWYENLA